MDMPLTRFWERGHNPMADKFNEKIQKWIEDGNGHERYAFASALFIYHSDAKYRHIPYQIKYNGNTETGEYFGRMLGDKLAGSELFADADMVIPVPLHWTRRWKRGYNQAEVIARAVAESMGIPMRNDILERRRRTKTQVKLGIEEKAKNVAGAFGVKADFADGNDAAGRVNLRHVILVDDVFTTGSTLASCFCALRAVFPPSVRMSAAALGYLER